MSLSNVSLVAFHYKSYGTFCIYSKRLHNFHGGFTHYRNYRASFFSLEKNKKSLGKVIDKRGSSMLE